MYRVHNVGRIQDGAHADIADIDIADLQSESGPNKYMKLEHSVCMQLPVLRLVSYPDGVQNPGVMGYKSGTIDRFLRLGVRYSAVLINSSFYLHMFG